MMCLKSLLLIVLCRTTGAASSTIYWVHGLNMSVGIDSDDGTLTKINVGFTLASFFSVSPCTSACSALFHVCTRRSTSPKGKHDQKTLLLLHWPQVAALLRDMCISLS